MTPPAHLEVLVEEASMEMALRAILPKLLRERPTFEIYSHLGKADLLAKLPQRLRGYRRWLPRGYRILVVVDRDGDDCRQLKLRLETMAAEAGFTTRSSSPSGGWELVYRIAIEELEAWYLGDLDAVRAVYPRLPQGIEQREGFRDPDGVRGGTWEAFERLLQRAGYFQGRLRKLEAARAISPLMDPARNRSRSFRRLCDVLEEISRE